MLPTTTFRRAVHSLGIHHYVPWLWLDAIYEAGPLMRAIMRNGPVTWKEPIQMRYCRICNHRQIRRLG